MTSFDRRLLLPLLLFGPLVLRAQKVGYDAVEWIARQPWSDGKVGTWGPSALVVPVLEER